MPVAYVNTEVDTKSGVTESPQQGAPCSQVPVPATEVAAGHRSSAMVNRLNIVTYKAREFEIRPEFIQNKF